MTGRELTRNCATVIAQSVHPGCVVSGVRALTGGVSASIHAIEIDDHPPLIVRQHPHVALEHATMTVIGAHDIPVPPMRLLDTSTEVLPDPFLVMDAVAGQSFVDMTDDVAVIAAEMADWLWAIHTVPVTDVTGRALLPSLDDEIAGLLAGTTDDLDAGRIRAHLHQAGFPDHDATCLLHGDYWPGNILVAEGRIAAIIDWEDAAIGSPLWDVANARLELLWSHGEAAIHAFSERYAQCSDMAKAELEQRLAPWDLLVALRPIGKIETWGLPTAKVTQMRFRHRSFTLDAMRRLPSRSVHVTEE